MEKMEPNSGDSAQSQAHIRGYQACLACRTRKVRCDLGPVDNPHGPPCARCKREHKTCHFTTSRRKRNHDVAETEDNEETSVTSSSPIQIPQRTFRDFPGQIRPLLPHLAFDSPIRRDSDDDPEVFDTLTARLQHAEITGNYSALNVLADVAVRKRSISVEDPNKQELLKIWMTFRFVREGWLSPSEAMEYIDYFYKWLAPMTPLTIGNMQDPAKLKRMLRDEAFLVLAVFTAVSRYMTLKGYGAMSRGHAIHSRFWQEIENSVTPLLISPRYTRLKSIVHPEHIPMRGIHGLHVAEALLLLIEWHPRAVHFPSNHQPGALLYDMDGESSSNEDEDNNSALQSWMKVLHGLDHKCWTLSQLALAIGVENSLYRWSEEEMSNLLAQPSHTYSADFRRAQNIRRLLYFHISLTTARLNQSPASVENFGKHLFSKHFFEKAGAYVNREDSDDASTPEVDNEFVQDLVSWFWCRLAYMTNNARIALYPTAEHAKHLIMQDIHRQTMQKFEADLSSWSKDLAKCNIIPKPMRAMLDIEFGNLRIYINQTALVAVVERCINLIPVAGAARFNGATSNATDLKTQPIPAYLLENQIGEERRFIDDLVDSAQKVLSTVEELCSANARPSEGLLRFAPARTFLRIFTVSTVLLKTFTCGATEESMLSSCRLFENVARAMQVYAIDDIHIAGIAAQSLHKLYRVVGKKAVRVTAMAQKDPAADEPDRRFPSHGSEIARTRRTRKVRARSFANAATNPTPAPHSQLVQEPLVVATPAQQQAQYPIGTILPLFDVGPRLISVGIDDPTATTNQTILGNISYNHAPTETYDLVHPQMSIMPPPTMNPAFPSFNAEDADMFNADDLAAPASMETSYFDEAFDDGEIGTVNWAVLPLDAVFEGVRYAVAPSVDQAGYGPTIGEMDLLEFFNYMPGQNEY